MDIFKFLPNTIYEFIGYGFVTFVILFFRYRLWQYVRVELPDEFMKHFRWITPLELQIVAIAVGINSFVIWKLCIAVTKLIQAVELMKVTP